jgi:hypothetical protein
MGFFFKERLLNHRITGSLKISLYVIPFPLTIHLNENIIYMGLGSILQTPVILQ